MKKILLALALCLASSGAWAQCNGVFPANTLCGNLSGSPAPPSAFSASGTVVGPGSSVIGDVAVWANTLGTQLADGGTLRLRPAGNFNFYVNGNSGASATCGPGGSQTCSSGSDSNTCLSNTSPCLTLQHVVALIYASYDLGIAASHIYLAHNTGTTNYDLICDGGAMVGLPVIQVEGDSSAQTTTVVQDPNLGYGLQIKDLCTLQYDYISFIDSPSTDAAGHIIVGATGNAGHLDLNDTVLGPLALNGGTMVGAGSLGSVAFTGSVTATGGASFALNASGSGGLFFQNSLWTNVGTPAFTAFAILLDGGEVGASAANFTGAATGDRCIVQGPISMAGEECNQVFPGNSDGVAQTYVGAIGIQEGSAGGSAFNYGAAGQALISGGNGTTNDSWATVASSASSPLVLNGSTGNLTCPTCIVNTVVGTWTPAVTATTTPGTPAYTTHVGSYEEFGRQVTVRFNVLLSGWTGSPSGNTQISGLPVASANTAGDYGVCSVGFYSVTALAVNSVGLTAIIAPNTSVILLYQNGLATSILLTAAQAGTTFSLIGVCNYHV